MWAPFWLRSIAAEDDAQRDLLGRIAKVLDPGGRVLFTAPEQACKWTDLLTGQRSRSLGAGEYGAVLESAGLILAATARDEGGNHYYDACKP